MDKTLLKGLAVLEAIAEMQGEGRAPLRQRGMGGEAEELLHADRQHRPALGFIINSHAVLLNYCIDNQYII